ncbi:hypothetical protein DS745_04285 [Anaerobacillus alkaliphilus]|uniref:Uncharacterized protein n=1 Tax=Anaerobacillus alkaliphilus TaxID=1548597 RepID=A0A4Q0VYH6_9BACI|nr:hypothetical protein [Anaerobacillus alkaliphilus]RXJ04609.1 hypothetical protein DS745_04285 [Anaerobacillus alkaliphilus]
MNKTSRNILFLMTVLPWLTIPFIGVKTLKRYIPASLFMVLYLIAEGSYAEKNKWWWFTTTKKPNFLGEMPLIFGPFLVGSLWILKYTFGNFKLYLLVNLIIDSIFTYLFTTLFKRMGYATLVRLKKVELSIVFIVKMLLLYLFQVVYDRYRKAVSINTNKF